jgi:hypothetical protein
MGQGYAEKGALWRIGPAYARFASAVNADVAQLVARNLAKVQVASTRVQIPFPPPRSFELGTKG